MIIAGNVSLFANNIENDVSIHVVLKENIEKQKDIEQAEQEIKQINGVRRVKFSDKDAELELMIKERGEELEMYRGKENPLSNAFFVYVNNADNVEKVTEEIKKLDFVSDAVYGGSSVKQMVQIINMVRTGGSIGDFVVDFAGALSDFQYDKNDHLCKKYRDFHYAKCWGSQLVYQSSFYAGRYDNWTSWFHSSMFVCVFWISVFIRSDGWTACNLYV